MAFITPRGEVVALQLVECRFAHHFALVEEGQHDAQDGLDLAHEVEPRDNSQAQGDAYQDRKRKLVECFEKIYGNIRVLFKHSYAGVESLDALPSLAASYDLNENFRKLVGLYNEWVENRDGILVLQIDDIDLQTRYAYDLVEQIRKYMIHPNVIILKAVRISQLEEVITRRYIEEFSSLLKGSPDNYMDKDAPVEMSERYLGKLIPHERRLFLPEMEANFTTPLVIVDPEIGGEGDEYPSIRDGVLRVIFKKTRVLSFIYRRSCAGMPAMPR